jgi:hypothetical protein
MSAKKSDGFTDEGRAAMKERARGLKAEASGWWAPGQELEVEPHIVGECIEARA